MSLIIKEKQSKSEIFNYSQSSVCILVRDIWKPNCFSNFYENKAAKVISKVVIIGRNGMRDLI